MRTSLNVIGIALLSGTASLAQAGGTQSVTLEPSKDATLYESGVGILANGSGQHLFSGVTLQGGTVNARRAVMEFDVAGSVPAGSTIVSVQVRLTIDRANNSGPFDFGLHEVLAEWGEGASDASGEEGSGTLAQMNDATWIHTFSPGSLWATPGGDFDPAASATTVLAEEGLYFYNSTPGLIEDVQGWLDDPSSNHGWMILGPENLSGVSTAKRFTSLQNANTAARPMLIVNYEAAADVCPGDCDDSGTVDFNDLVSMLFEFGAPSSPEACDADESGAVDFNDLVSALFLFGPCP